MLGLNLHISRNQAILSRDASWESLHKRGYRPIQSRAPINEALAAGLLLASGWTGQTALADVMCGGGTFLIEGAWIAARRPPGLTRKWFGFFGWPDFNRNLWTAIRDEARAGVRKELPFAISGSDERNDAIAFAENNARAAGAANLISFRRQDLREARPPDGEPGTVIVNPPYGERLEEERNLMPLYRDLGRTIGEHWPGWKLVLFAMNDQLAREIGLKVSDCRPFFNGRLPCRLWEFTTQS
jgi:putative N6-adenine-specific DNA methylase